jgi:hypothetical protein
LFLKIYKLRLGVRCRFFRFTKYGINTRKVNQVEQ